MSSRYLDDVDWDGDNAFFESLKALPLHGQHVIDWRIHLASLTWAAPHRAAVRRAVMELVAARLKREYPSDHVYARRAAIEGDAVWLEVAGWTQRFPADCMDEIGLIEQACREFRLRAGRALSYE
jgi:hypothetical protein